MKRLLIVEDEKIIRQGLRVMIQRTPTRVEEILECTNGEEALNILRSTQVDVLFTNVRMPRMDGISLIRHLKELPFPPLPVIISGYDNFSYAVEALRCGAKEYLQKPISREEVAQVLASLELLLQERFAREQRNLEYVLENPGAQARDWASAQAYFDYLVHTAPFYVVASHSAARPSEAVLCLKYTRLPRFFYLFKESCPGDQALLAEGCFGKSGLYTSFGQLPEACHQARDAYFSAFFQRAAGESGEAAPSFPEEELDRMVLILGTKKPEEARAVFDRLFAQAVQGKLAPEGFFQAVDAVFHKLDSLYAEVVAPAATRRASLREHGRYGSIARYQAALWEYLQECGQLILSRRRTSRKDEKMEEAVAFIRKNYQKDLNMAMASNYISVSYSFFSQAFKDYTGKNFSRYLKEVRIEKAKELLTQTQLHISEISKKAGFENEKHFMKVFRTLVGVSPTEYRRSFPPAK